MRYLALMLAFTIGGCSTSATGDDNLQTSLRTETIRVLFEDIAATYFDDFASRSAALSSATQSLCSDPTESALDEARAAWSNARTPQKMAEIVRFGPLESFPEYLRPKLDSWPVRADAVEELIEGDEALTAEAFSIMGAARRGMPVVEYLLWNATEDTLESLQRPRRCEALMGAAADIAVNTQLLVTLWETTWRAPLTTPADAEHMTYKTTQDVIDEWVNRMLFTVENIRVEKLGKPLGDKTGGNPSLQSLESRYSGRSLQDAKDALAGVAAVWQGSDDVAPNGIAALVADDAELTQWLTAQLSASRGRLEDIADPLEESVLVEPEIIQRAQDVLRTLQVVVQVDLAQALGVTIAFNDNDGD